MADLISQRQVVEELGGILDCIGSKAGMQVLYNLEIPTPPTKGQVPRPDKEVALGFADKNGYLRMKYAGANDEWLYLVLLANSARTVLAQSDADSLHISENKRSSRTAADECV